MHANINNLIPDKIKGYYKAVITVNGITFESVTIDTLENWSKVFNTSVNELVYLVKR